MGGGEGGGGKREREGGGGRRWAISWGMNVFLIFRLYKNFLVGNSLSENSFQKSNKAPG